MKLEKDVLLSIERRITDGDLKGDGDLLALIREVHWLRSICERVIEADEDYDEGALMTLRVIAEELREPNPVGPS